MHTVIAAINTRIKLRRIRGSVLEFSFIFIVDDNCNDHDNILDE